MVDASGYERHLTFQILNDTHFHSERILSTVKTYDFFAKSEDVLQSPLQIVDRVVALCQRVIGTGPMGTTLRIGDMFGLTPVTLMEHDFYSLLQWENRVDEIQRAADDEARLAAKAQEEASAEINKGNS